MRRKDLVNFELERKLDLLEIHMDDEASEAHEHLSAVVNHNSALMVKVRACVCPHHQHFRTFQLLGILVAVRVLFPRDLI